MASVLADFVAHLTVEAADWEDPIEGRVLLSETQLVLAEDEDTKKAIPIDAVFDINTETTPKFVDPMPGRPVTVAYREGDSRATAVVSADETTSKKFETVLFKAILNGTYTILKHPSKVGGRVMDTEFQGGIMGLSAGAVQFDTDEGPIEIPLDGIVDFSREQRTVNGEDRPVLVVSHMDNGEALETVAAADSSRKLSILGRYLRGTYQRLLESLKQISLSDSETEALTTIYSTGDMDVSLPSVLGMDPKTVKRVLHSLHDNGLVESGENGPVLTAKGQIVVNEYLERIND
ncbi:HTH domain-containing protein [Halovenus aranensis]|uniref:HTH domain-containing protein n=1 Tax=Halovenus aranensis TaxID=890420 RepID=A0A1G8Y756_9EURY|nr:CheF family chemotaxis protein [Halovenus aranensis]SDJ98543.1 HTH domain-containing protein [Halovenus aranensis]